MTYSYEEALNASTQYFNGNELSAKVFVDKYALRNNDNELVERTPHQMHLRIAQELARIEQKKFKDPLSISDIYKLLDRFHNIIPQGSPLYGIGNKYKNVSLSNCFVLDSPVDSYGGIFKTDQELAQISKRRGGNGFDISELRPSDVSVNNSANVTTGAVSFLHRFSATTMEVGQSGRRGATMLTMSVHHPDIEKFITVKNDKTKATGVNISVRLTNEFLTAVENDINYEQRWPIDTETPEITKMVSARHIWNIIIRSSWLRAEPGILFWDNITSESPLDCYPECKTISTNPSLCGDTKILTNYGIVPIKDLIDTTSPDLMVKNIDEKWCHFDAKKTGTNKQLMCITFNNQQKIYCTPEHKWPILDYKNDIRNQYNNKIIKKTTSDLKQQDKIPLIYNANPFNNNDTLNYNDGVVVGLRMDADMKYKSDGISDMIWKGGNDFIKGVISGLFSTHGYVECKLKLSNCKVLLVSSNKQLIEDIQKLLCFFGIRSNINKNIRFYLIIRGLHTQKFAKTFDLLNKKQDKLDSIKKLDNNAYKNDRSYLSVKSVELTNIYTDVYDLTVHDITNTFNIECGITGNCGEIPLCAYDSCRLLLINLMGCVEHPFTSKAKFDYDKFYNLAQIAQRLMDDIIDLEIECVNKIINKIKQDIESDEVKATELQLWKKILTTTCNTRRTGVGVTAVGDMIASLGYEYGGEQSIKEIEHVYKTLKLGCYKSSVDMAQELGAFPLWDVTKEINNPFLLRIKEDDPTLYERMQMYGRRNGACITTAPAGSVSTQAGYKINDISYYGTTSGIEPLFDISYIKRKKGHPGEQEFISHFIDIHGDHWMDFPIYHSGIQAWHKLNPDKDINESPYVCANDLNWKNRVKLQATAQQHVDHSISSTVNLPADITEEEVAIIYETAWKSGCKGITVYRDGCRDGVLIKNKPKPLPDKRPRELPCDVYHISVQGQPYFVMVGLYNGKPYEVFAGKNGIVSKRVKHGKIIRKRQNFYKAIFDNDDELAPITNACSDIEECVTRLTSGLLRTGADMLFIVDQLEKVGERQDVLHSFAKSVARALKKYIPNGSKQNGLCEECEMESLIRQDGCILCQSCGWSKCL